MMSISTHSLRKNQRGFTLIELMMAVLILAVIGSYTGSTLFATFRTHRLIEEKTNMNDVGTAISLRLSEDLSQLFFVESYQKLTYLKLTDTGGRPTLQLTAFSHAPSSPGARESDECELTYKVDTGSGEAKTLRLLRKEQPYLDGFSEENDMEGFTQLTDRLSQITIELSEDGQTWQTAWDSASPAFMNKIPKLARITFELENEDGKKQFFESFVEIPLSENLSMSSQTTASQGNSSQNGQSGSGAQNNNQNNSGEQNTNE
ncbi:MAG: prepilin-type N-terminal cleavage/methylation domain-containing protein [Bdellovibrionota bacterium]